MLSTHNLSVTAIGSDGQALAGYRVIATLTKTDYTTEGVVLPRVVSAETDENGSATLALVSNLVGTQDSRYRIRITNKSGGSVQSVSIQMPEANAELSQLVDQVPVTTEYSTAAALSASIASDKADIATQKADETAADRVATGQDRTAAEQAKQTATAAASEAATVARRINTLYWLGV